ncbi:MAG: RecX family transcriptional regulator, partial [Chloroflexota bacterium]
LRRKGVSPETAAQVTQGLDDQSSAYRVGKNKARSLCGLDYQDFRRKLGSYLHRRGFDYSTATEVVNRLWQEALSSSRHTGLKSEE